MDNRQMNFDPMTGEPIVQNENIDNTATTQQAQTENIQVVSTPQVESTNETNQVTQTEVTQSTANTQQQTIENVNSIQQQMQNIPTVEQNKQDFISNTQADSTAKEEVKKDGPNITFIVIMFLIIFASIFFLFPYLLKILG